MVSNKLSSRRTFLVRPKVCKSLPKIKLAAMASAALVYFDPSQKNEGINQWGSVDFYACLPCEAVGSDVAIVWTADGLELNAPPIVPNCTTVSVDFRGANPGQFAILAQCTWQSGAYAVARCVITITEIH